ncbi:MAG: DPP IV N-terminal domain-containing protein, partial [Aureliella sp.]
MSKPMPRNFHPSFSPAILFLCLCGWALLQPLAVADDHADRDALAKLKTVAEASDYRATADGAATELFLKRLERHWPKSRLESLGATGAGRASWGLIVDPDEAVAADASGSRDSGTDEPLTVLLLGGIHSGECDGKEALLALARDLARGEHRQSHRSLRLIFVPNFNADGNERVGKLHRPGQNGPEAGMGVRENAQNLDLNRDFVKLETPEVRALVATLTRYDVDVLIDTHTTNGSLHRYDLTYAVPQNPAAPREIDAWLRKDLLPTVSGKLQSAGIPTFYYGNFTDEHKRWKTYGHEPRYSTELMGLRGKIGILAESYSHATYQRRIEATYAFVNEVLKQLDQQYAQVTRFLDAAASDNRAGASLAVRGELSTTDRDVAVRGYQAADGKLPSPPFDSDSAPKYQPHDYRVELQISASPEREVSLPHAYAVPPACAWALSRLQLQGVQIERLTEDVPAAPCEVLAIDKVESGASLQHHTLKRVTASVKKQLRPLTAGTHIVRTAQPLGTLAAYLLEPESDDGLAAWNFFDPDLAPEWEYPILRVHAELAGDKLVAVSEIEPGEELTLEHLMQPEHTAEYFSTSTSNARWLGNELLVEVDGQWRSVDPDTGSSEPSELVENMKKAFAALEAFQSDKARQRVTPSILTEDGKFGLLSQEKELYLFDAASGSARQLTQSPDAEEELAQVSPTGQQVAFVRDNDLFLIDVASAKQRRLTHDGSSELLNGILDWVYQEELYGRGNFRAFWFSPDGKQLAFLQLDESPVHHYRVSDSISYRQDLEDTRYPKAGDPLPVVQVWLAEVESGKLRKIDLSDFPANDRLVVRVSWSPDNELWLQIQNRIQTEQAVVRVDPRSGRAQRVLEEESPGWIEVLGTPKFLPDGDFLWLSDLPDGRRHLTRYDVQGDKLARLTNGGWDIAEILAVSPDGRTAFVSGNLSHPTEMQLVSVDTQTGKLDQLTEKPGTHRVRLAPDCRHFIDSWSALKEPPRTALKSIDGQLERMLGAPVSDRYRYVKLAEPQMVTIPARDGKHLHGM